jgi:hypothetical protein
VNTWFVSTVNRLPGNRNFSLIWAMEEFATEAAARRYAKDALNLGLRVEAGTLSEIEPKVRIHWREAADWAASGEAASSLADYRRRPSPEPRLRRQDQNRIGFDLGEPIHHD